MNELAKRLEDLSPEKRELLLRALWKTPAETPAAPGERPSAEAGDGRILPRVQGTPPPLSYGQQRLWFLDQLYPGNSTYNLFAAFEVEGRFEWPVLEAVVQEIVRRHDILRTTFDVHDEADAEPVQLVAPVLRLDVPLIDVSGLGNGAKSEAELLRTVKWIALEPYDLRRGPLVRVTLLRLAAQRHVILVATHHIVFDDWSSVIFGRELYLLYLAFVRGEPAVLTELPIQYADFACWQRRRLRGERLERLVSYWKEQLAGAPSVLELPTDRPRSVHQSFRGGWVSVEIPCPLAEELGALARRSGATSFMVQLAAFQILLARYAGVNDVVVGAPVAGHNRLELEGLIGFFVNNLVLRADFSGNPSFAEFLEQVRVSTLGAFAHQEIPFEMLVQELQPERSTGHAMVFQVVINLLGQAPKQREAKPSELVVTSLELELPNAMFDLNLTLKEKAAELRGRLDYDAALFDRSTIVRMSRHLEAVMRSVVADPQTRLAELTLLTPAERHQMGLEWRGTENRYPVDCLHRRFEAQVDRVPDAVALHCEDRASSYGELDLRANRLARYLVCLGVGPDVPVGICLEPGLDMVTALLGVLKAGGAYLPLDPGLSGKASVLHPRRRARRRGESGPVDPRRTGGVARGHAPTATLPAPFEGDLPRHRPSGHRRRERTQPGGPCHPREPGLPDLYLGLDGSAERGAPAPCRRGAVDVGDPRLVRLQRE